MQIRLLTSIGGRGLTPETFRDELRGIHVDRADRLWTVGDAEVKQFDPAGRLLRRWPTGSPALCITLDARERVWLGGDGWVGAFDAQGRRLEELRDPPRLGRVTAIGFIGDDLLLADATHRCIRRYDRHRRFVLDIGAKNNTRGFLVPNGHLELAIDEKGIIHATNPGKYRVERYTADGELLGHFGRFGTRDPEHFPGCCNPTNLALLPGGRVAVTEKAPPRMKVHDADGRLLGLVGPEAFDAGCKNMDVAADSRANVYVADTVRLWIRVFACQEAVAGAGPRTRPPADREGAVPP
ncbi:MAG: hypothetical protein AMXMBFR83_31520 [Phycisphaerae bacterium]